MSLGSKFVLFHVEPPHLLGFLLNARKGKGVRPLLFPKLSVLRGLFVFLVFYQLVYHFSSEQKTLVRLFRRTGNVMRSLKERHFS